MILWALSGQIWYSLHPLSHQDAYALFWCPQVCGMRHFQIKSKSLFNAWNSSAESNSQTCSESTKLALSVSGSVISLSVCLSLALCSVCIASLSAAPKSGFQAAAPVCWACWSPSDLERMSKLYFSQTNHDSSMWQTSCSSTTLLHICYIFLVKDKCEYRFHLIFRCFRHNIP